MVHWSFVLIGFMIGTLFGVFIYALLTAGRYFDEDPENAHKKP